MLVSLVGEDIVAFFKSSRRGLPKNVLQHFLYLRQNQQEMSEIFSVLLQRRETKRFLAHVQGVVEMAWYDDVRFK
jgi:hypothetical protein